MNENLNGILGVELICAAQGIEFRAPLMTSPALQAALKLVREAIPAIKDDRYLADDITVSAQMIADGQLLKVTGLDGYVTGASQ